MTMIVRLLGLPTEDLPRLKNWSDCAIGVLSGLRSSEEVAAYRPGLVVLAGFMKLFGEAYLARFGGRTLNTHPALSPSFPGMHGPADALEYGVKVTGCTLFVVDSGVDTGPIVAQVAVPVLEDDDAASLHERIKIEERQMLVDAVERIARDGFTVEGRIVRFGS